MEQSYLEYRNLYICLYILKMQNLSKHEVNDNTDHMSLSKADKLFTKCVE